MNDSQGGQGSGQPKNQQFVVLNKFRREHLRVDVFLVSGIRLNGRIKSFDQYTMLLETADGEAVVYHHAVSSIGRSMPRPRRGPPRADAMRRDDPMRRDEPLRRDDPMRRDEPLRRDEPMQHDAGPRRAPASAPDVVVIRRRSRLTPGGS